MKEKNPDRLSFLSQQSIGLFAVFGSAFCFYLATLIIRWAEAHVAIEASFFVFSRFLFGFLIVTISLVWQKRRLLPKRYHYLIGRTLTNTIAVFSFYKAVEVGSVAEANILNMTYPLFVALFAWLFLKGQRDILSLVIVSIAFLGIWLVLSPGDLRIGINNFWGLCSGISAAGAIIYLNMSRRYHDSQTILFYMFGLGALLIFIIFRNDLFWPDREELFFLLACSAAGVAGQYLLTYGFYYVTAVEGSIISSSRILLAALLGPFLAAETPLTMVGWCGAILIFGANAALAYRKQKEQSY